MKKIFLILPVLVFLAVGCNKKPAEVNNPPVNQNQIYETAYLKITVPNGWVVKEANKTTEVGNCTNGQNCTTTTKTEPNPAAVNITKGNYVLYINTQAEQASGVEGGRFAEVAMGAPSVDAVVTEQPSPPCGTMESHLAFADRTRQDLYVNNQEKNSYCVTPKNGSTVWYFSYITGPKDGYFNYYVPGEAKAYVITMAYNSKDVNSFPVKGSQELNTSLNDMTNMLKTLEIKIK